MEQLIRTGEAAQILGTSRQHVVDLVNRGAIRNYGSAVHRRLDRDEVSAMRSSSATRDDRQSLWLHTAVAGRIAREPSAALSRARRNLDRMAVAHGEPSRWLRRWRDVIDRGPETVISVLTSDTPEARELRQNSPFAGVLTERERTRALQAFQDLSRAGDADRADLE